MLPDNLDSTTEDDIQNLVTNQVGENRTIEYKIQLPGNSDADKKEFLADISALSNTVGGDIIFGIREENAIAVEVVGVNLVDPDTEITRLESIITSGLQPRIDHDIFVVLLTSGQYIVIIRTRKSFIGPHRVIFRAHDKFYGRSSTGKYALDVEQLRTAFLQENTVSKKIKDFHETRILEIEAERSPLPLSGENKIIIHLIPRESYSSNTTLSKDQLRSLRENIDGLQPIHTGGNWYRPEVNLEGIISHAGRGRGVARSYLQVFRNGIMEAVESSILDRDGGDTIPSLLLEEEINNHTRQCLGVLRSLSITTPIYVFITLTGVKGLRMANGDRQDDDDEVTTIRKNILNLPEATFESYDQNVARTLRPSIEMVWNASGIVTSPNFNANGDWHPRD